MKSIFKQLLFFCFFAVSNEITAQKNITSFGITYKPMIGGSFINEGDKVKKEDNIAFGVSKLFGYNAGMVIRHNFTKMFALETGISFTKRNFNMNVFDAANKYTYDQDFSTTTYEIPIQGLVYIQLNKQIFMDVSFGFVADVSPSNIAVIASDRRLFMEGQRKNWLLGALTANIGWEWRTEKYGAFYIGGTYHRTFGDMYGFLLQYEYDSTDPNSSATRVLNIANGNYLTLDFRYFFHVDAKKQEKARKARKSGRAQ